MQAMYDLISTAKKYNPKSTQFKTASDGIQTTRIEIPCVLMNESALLKVFSESTSFEIVLNDRLVVSKIEDNHIDHETSSTILNTFLDAVKSRKVTVYQHALLFFKSYSCDIDLSDQTGAYQSYETPAEALIKRLGVKHSCGLLLLA